MRQELATWNVGNGAVTTGTRKRADLADHTDLLRLRSEVGVIVFQSGTAWPRVFGALGGKTMKGMGDGEVRCLQPPLALTMLLKALTHEIIGSFYDVYNVLGYGFLESTYQRALVVELLKRGISVRTEVPISVYYQGVNVGDFRLDLVVNEAVIVECKAVEKLSIMHRAQLIHYLRATSFPLGLLFNFGPEPKLHRFIQSKRCPPLHGTNAEESCAP